MPLSWQKTLPPLATFAAIVLVIGCLYWAQPVFIPTALAILLSFILSPVVTALQRRGLGRTPAVIVVVISAGIIIGIAGWLIVAQIGSLADKLPTYQENITQRISQLRSHENSSLLGKLQNFVEKVGTAAKSPSEPNRTGTQPQAFPVRIVDSYSSWNGTIMAGIGPLLAPFASGGLVVVLVIYLLINREDLRNRLFRLIGQGHMTTTTKALDDAGRRISRYLFMQFMLNAAFGVVIGGGLWLLQVPHALLWGFCAAFLRYIPFVGPWIAAILPVSLSLLISSDWWQPSLVVMLFVTFELIGNLVLEPRLYGKSIGVSSSALIVAIAFWAWLWGPVGLMLAAPLTVCLVVLGKYVPHLKFFNTLLGDESVFTADVNFYQRLVARDQDEASELSREQLKTFSLEQIFDQTFIPALVYARQDLEGDRLTEQELLFIAQATKEIAEEQGLENKRDQSLEESPTRDRARSDFRLKILGCAARDAADEAGLVMLQELLDSENCQLTIVNTDRLVSEVVEQVDQERPAIVCIAALPPGGLTHSRLLCSRLRRRFPELKIVVGRWGLQSNIEDNRKQLDVAGASYFGTTLQETVEQLKQLAQCLRPETPGVELENGNLAQPALETSRGKAVAIPSL